MAVWVAVSLAFMVMLLVVVDDDAMNALFYREAKLFLMRFASGTTLERPDLIDCNLCHRLRLYAIRSAEFRCRSKRALGIRRTTRRASGGDARFDIPMD